MIPVREAHSPLRLAVLCTVLATLAGCAGGPTPESSVDEQTAPCAGRLHDISGRLLMYYSLHNKLPANVRELDKVDASPATPAVCPVSGKPYIYRPTGVALQGRAGRLILYDPKPCHSGRLWGIMQNPPKPDQPLILRVISVAPADLKPAILPPASSDAASPAK